MNSCSSMVMEYTGPDDQLNIRQWRCDRCGSWRPDFETGDGNAPKPPYCPGRNEKDHDMENRIWEWYFDHGGPIKEVSPVNDNTPSVASLASTVDPSTIVPLGMDDAVEEPSVVAMSGCAGSAVVSKPDQPEIVDGLSAAAMSRSTGPKTAPQIDILPDNFLDQLAKLQIQDKAMVDNSSRCAQMSVA